MPGAILTNAPLAAPPNGDSFINPPPFAPHPLRQVRSGKIKKVFGKFPVDSAIYKVQLSGPVPVGHTGILSDEQAWEGHGGPDKALLHYSAAHYDEWKEELPLSKHLLNAGGFGENLVSDGLDERTVCIGDRIKIGEEVIVEVTGNRAPCSKLNHRFEIKDMAKRAQTLYRTGWMYRVLKTGNIRVGDMIELLERPCPEWPVARLMHYLYNEKDNKDRMREALELEQVDESLRRILKNRLEKGEVEDQNARMFGPDGFAMDTWSDFRIAEKRRETSTVTAFILEAVDQEEKPVQVEPGSHVRLKLGGDLVRAYSVVGGTSNRFELGIALDVSSRGGSKYLHEETTVGDILIASRITASFPLAAEADRHIMIAGGIGITAFLAAIDYLEKSDRVYELHFAVRERIPFADRIAAFGSHVKVYNRSKGEQLDLDRVISYANGSTHIYCCGPQRLMDGVETAADKFGIPRASVHFEQFAVSTSGDPFTAELRESKKVVEVAGSQTLLDALKKTGMDIDSSCEAGNCGTCRVNLVSGRVDHRGTGLLDSEKQSTLLSCVSRGIGRIVLDL
ncbi:pyruvate kinase-like protein [Dendryphion nanum]|uniref:Pyruvate kinase-like protein n=1 Tax=Dendryphion nanum TaxID=256645 RepID=A0A9P9DI84_9PLEO|nr:pyruvate kinase-like protein [Dendryphion nanum]